MYFVFMVFALIPVLMVLNFDFLLSITALNFVGRRKSRLGKNNLACFLGIALGIFIWGVLVQSIQIGELSSRSMEGYDALLLSTFLLGLTPVAALLALMTFGPGKK